VGRAKDSVLLEQIVDHRLLLAIDPPGEQQDEEGERRRQRVDGKSVPKPLPRFKDDLERVNWAEFPGGTRPPPMASTRQ
jgi:ribosomal protein S6E (S10)